MSALAAILIGMAGASPMLALPPAMVGEIAEGKRFVGGMYAGLGVGDAVTPDGKRFRGLRASLPGASPIAAEDQPAVNAYIAGHADPTKAPLSAFLAKHPVLAACFQLGQPCAAGSSQPVSFGEPVTANTPYRLEGHRIRIEWLYGTALFYISELEVRKGRISRARTQPAWLPLKVRAPN